MTLDILNYKNEVRKLIFITEIKVKKITLIFVFFASISFSNAAPQQPVSDKEHESNCRDLMEIAHTVMQEKQKGMSLKEMLERNDHANESESNQYLYEMIQLIIRDAFTQSESADKNRQLSNFSSKYYLGCMEMYKPLY